MIMMVTVITMMMMLLTPLSLVISAFADVGLVESYVHLIFVDYELLNVIKVD